LKSQTVIPQIACSCGNISNLTEVSCAKCGISFDLGKNVLICPTCKTVRQITIYYEIQIQSNTILSIVSVKVLFSSNGKKLWVAGIPKTASAQPTIIPEPFCSKCDYAYPTKKLLV